MIAEAVPVRCDELKATQAQEATETLAAQRRVEHQATDLGAWDEAGAEA